jgi:glycosyltransferase involved in cell wall biosynthesis
MNNPLVSILIRVRDEADLLDRTLRSLREQVLDADMEIVVLDNESTDGSTDVALAYGARVFTFPRSLFGYGRALNLGIELCGGDIVVLLSAHSIPQADTWVADLIRPLRDGTAGAAFCRQVPPGQMPRPQLRRFACFPAESVVMDKTQFMQQCAAGRDPYEPALFSNSACAIRRDLAIRAPFRDLPYSEDRAFVVDYVLTGGTVAYVHDAAVAYDRRLSWNNTYRAHYRCQISRHLVRELAASYTGHRFRETRDNLKKIFQAVLVVPAACRGYAAALTEPPGLRRQALRQVPLTMAATLGTAMGVLRWRRYQALTGRDLEIMHEAREQCVPLHAEAAQGRP